MKRTRWHQISLTLVALAGWTMPVAAQPDPTNSFYVPQIGLDYGSPTEGDAAIRYFRACPNNDEGASLPLNARIMLVVRDSDGVPIPDIPATKLCVLLNGGTLAQGFVGDGADSVIANGTWNFAPLCPDLLCIPADGPTDGDGVAYITFTGPGGVRDANRKWGHYDTELPVYASDVQIPGRITKPSASGSYVLRIKNFDHTGGLSAVLNQGEVVGVVDYNSFIVNVGVHNATSYWRDFDSDGVSGLSDLNMIIWHFGHDCGFPNSP